MSKASLLAVERQQPEALPTRGPQRSEVPLVQREDVPRPVMARWAPPTFKNGVDPDTTEGAIDLIYALPKLRVEYLRVEPPGIPTQFS